MNNKTQKKTKRITIRDVANYAGVTPGTASLALNRDPSELKFSMDTITRIQEAAKKLNYRPNPVAQRLVTGAMAFPSVTILAPTEHGFGNLHNEEVLIGTILVAAAAGIKVETLVTQFDSSGQPKSDFLRELDTVDGFILHSWCNIGDESVLEPLLATGKPFVLANHYIGDERIPCIGGGSFSAGEKIAKHLLELGHRNIAVMPGPAVLERTHCLVAGLRAEMAKQGSDVPDENVNFSLYTDPNTEFIEKIISQQPQLTAFVTASDELATKVIIHLQAKGFDVPGDFSVTGEGNDAYGKFLNPQLTTINEHGREIGQKAMQMLVNLIDKKPTETKIRINFELIVRQSTGPAKGM